MLPTPGHEVVDEVDRLGGAHFATSHAVVLGGLLATLEPLLAAVRSQLYDSCHPLATRDLRIEPSRAGIDAGVLRAGQLALRHVLAAR